MKKTFLSLGILFLCCLGLAFKLEAASLFQPGNQMNYLFVDHKARAVGDTLTIIITESTSTTQNASTTTKKSTEQKYGVPQVGGSGSNIINKTLDKIFPLSNSNDSSFNGTGSTTRSGNFNGRLSVMVKEILPNGDFLVEGSQNIKVNKEDQEITVTGIVRPVDITPYNTVLSTQVGNAQITYKGKGVVGNTQKEGILTKILNFVF
ncbi:MAG: flagellar basal body L-ring protein FlgH [bacterium]